MLSARHACPPLQPGRSFRWADPDSSQHDSPGNCQTRERFARRHGRSLNAEILTILADKAEMTRRRAEAAKVIPRLRKLREEIDRKYPNQPDSVNLIREGRDSR